MLTAENNIVIIVVCCALGLLYAIFNALVLSKVQLTVSHKEDTYNSFKDEESVQDHHIHLLLEIGHLVERGANAFLFQEYKYIGIFCVFMAFVIFFAVEQSLGQLWTTAAFLLGCITSVLAGFIGMRVATFSNYRCAFKAQSSMSAAFSVAYRAGCVMGFGLCSLGLLNLTILICLYQNIYVSQYEDFTTMYECIAGYGLGGSTIALFGRVGGGIFTKAADVGADLVGKVEKNLPEDSPQNPATIADNVGDNVGDIAGMGADLFGSFAESTTAALVVGSASPTFFYQPSGLWYPLMLSAFGIVVSIITSLFAHGKTSDTYAGVNTVLKQQLLLSSALATAGIWFAGYITLPDRLYGLAGDIDRQPVHAWICGLCGLWSGLIIGFLTEYYTSHGQTPVREVAGSCKTGAATNIIYGLALGNLSTVVPIILLAITAFVCHSLLGMFGIALGALGMLNTLAIGLAIDGYGPVSDNAGGFAEMAELGEEIRQRTDALDAAGNTTAAIGKGFAIGSAGLVSLSLYGAYLTRASNFQNKNPIRTVNVDSPLIFSGLMIGAMLPYAFSALTMKSVGKAALEMVQEVRKQLEQNPGILNGTAKPNYERCVQIATTASLFEMFLPAIIVLLTPFTIGIFLGPTAVAGVLPGILISGVSMAIAQANSGGAWDNAKKYIESGQFTVDGQVKKKGSDEHKAAVIGDTVGDPLKDTSGPSLNILIKLSAIFSLIFAKFFDDTAILYKYISAK